MARMTAPSWTGVTGLVFVKAEPENLRVVQEIFKGKGEGKIVPCKDFLSIIEACNADCAKLKDLAIIEGISTEGADITFGFDSISTFKLPFVVLSEEYAQRVQNIDVEWSNGSIWVIHDPRLKSDEGENYLDPYCKVVTYSTTEDALDFSDAAMRMYNLVVIDLDILQGNGDTFSDMITHLGVPLVIRIPKPSLNYLDERVADAQPALVITEPFREVYVPFIMSLMRNDFGV